MELVNQTVDRQPVRQPCLAEVFFNQAAVAASVRKTELDLLAETPSAENSGVNLGDVVGRPDQEDVVLRFKSGDLDQDLFHQLCIVRAQLSVVARQKSDLIEEQNRGRVFAGAREGLLDFLNGIAHTSAQHVGRSDCVEAALGTRRD